MGMFADISKHNVLMLAAAIAYTTALSLAPFILILLSLAANLAIFTFLFTMMFHFIPSRRVSRRQSLISGICATLFFLLGKHLIGLYLGNASVGSAYGAAGSLIVFLVWVYYTTLVLLVSHEFANNIFIDKAEQPPLYYGDAES